MIIEPSKSLKDRKIENYNDHRIAMSLAITGMLAEGKTIINSFECVNISFPNFFEILNTFIK